jgi:hypothetical protein
MTQLKWLGASSASQHRIFDQIASCIAFGDPPHPVPECAASSAASNRRPHIVLNGGRPPVPLFPDRTHLMRFQARPCARRPISCSPSPYLADAQCARSSPEISAPHRCFLHTHRRHRHRADQNEADSRRYAVLGRTNLTTLPTGKDGYCKQ